MALNYENIGTVQEFTLGEKFSEFVNKPVAVTDQGVKYTDNNVANVFQDARLYSVRECMRFAMQMAHMGRAFVQNNVISADFKLGNLYVNKETVKLFRISKIIVSTTFFQIPEYSPMNWKTDPNLMYVDLIIYYVYFMMKGSPAIDLNERDAILSIRREIGKSCPGDIHEIFDVYKTGKLTTIKKLEECLGEILEALPVDTTTASSVTPSSATPADDEKKKKKKSLADTFCATPRQYNIYCVRPIRSNRKNLRELVESSKMGIVIQDKTVVEIAMLVGEVIVSVYKASNQLITNAVLETVDYGLDEEGKMTVEIDCEIGLINPVVNGSHHIPVNRHYLGLGNDNDDHVGNVVKWTIGFLVLYCYIPYTIFGGMADIAQTIINGDIPFDVQHLLTEVLLDDESHNCDEIMDLFSKFLL